MRRSVLVILLGAVLCAACAISHTVASDSGASDAGVAEDASVESDGSFEEEDAGSPAGPIGGAVVLSQYTNADGERGTALGASFREEPYRDRTRPLRTLADCSLYPPSSTRLGRTRSAGTLEADFEGRGTLEARPSALGVYAASTPDFLLSGGERIRVRASGGDVPPFEGELVAPRAFDLEVPPVASATEALTLRWDPTDLRGDVTVQILPGRIREPFVRCRADATVGELTIPEAFMRELARDTAHDLGATLTVREAVVGAERIELRMWRAAPWAPFSIRP